MALRVKLDLGQTHIWVRVMTTNIIVENLRVSGDGDVDVNMMDIGRPPEVGLNKRVSWAEKVTGSNGGGILKPESVVDDDFVSSRMCVEVDLKKPLKGIIKNGSEWGKIFRRI